MSTLRAVFAVLVSLQVFCGVAKAQSDCDSVLSITGREQQVYFSDEMRAEYKKHTASNRSRYGLNVVDPRNGMGYGGDAEQQAATSDTRFSAWRHQYFLAADTVFEPAIRAWLACREGSTVLFKPTHLSDNELEVALRAAPAANPRLTGIDADNGVACKRGATVLTATLSINLDNNPLTIRCKRTDSSTGAKVVRFETNVGTYRLTMPRAVAPQRQWNDAQAEKIAITNCDSVQMLPAADRPRTLRIKDFFVYSDGTSANGWVSVNGIKVVTASGNKVPGHNLWATPSVSSSILIPPWMPIVLHSAGGADNGGCSKLGGYALIM